VCMYVCACVCVCVGGGGSHSYLIYYCRIFGILRAGNGDDMRVVVRE
jgi:hypothetical protein